MNTHPTPIATLVACVATKAPTTCEARELYVSPWFRKARAYAESSERSWWILSAKHFLLAPTAIVAPYDETIVGADRDRRRQWAWHTAMRFAVAYHVRHGFRMKGSSAVVEVLAGTAYREFLFPALRARGFEPVAPMEGLGIGEQLAWLTKATEEVRS